MSVDDVVIIHSENQPRGMWNLGRVEELIIGNDGEARAAVLRVAGQGRRSKCLQRPVQRLYPLETSFEMSSQNERSESNYATHELEDHQEEHNKLDGTPTGQDELPGPDNTRFLNALGELLHWRLETVF